MAKRNTKRNAWHELGRIAHGHPTCSLCGRLLTRCGNGPEWSGSLPAWSCWEGLCGRYGVVVLL